MYKTARRPTANYNRKKTSTAINYNRKKTSTAINYNRKKTSTVRRLQKKENYNGKPTLPTTSHCKAVHLFCETH